jgi:threonine dehydratase
MAGIKMTDKNKIFQTAEIRVSYEDICLAQKTLEPILRKTELIESQFFSSECGNRVFLKPENFQVTGSFKIRGAYYKISKLSDEEKSRGVIAASAGNHAQGVGYAAQMLGVKATIVMPETTPIIKVEATKNFGVQVVLHGDTYDDACRKARELEAENGYVFVHPFDDIDVMLGQGTVAMEVLKELDDADEILIPIGGGGLISGMAMVARMLKPGIKIIGVEPEGACCIARSLDENRVIELKKVDTMADGAAVKKPGDLTFEVIKKLVDEVVTVSDSDILEAILLLIERHKMVTEGAGALSVAGLKKLAPENKNAVCVVSGGNIDISTISAIINRALVLRGRQFCFTVNLPDKPGELLNVAKILADLRANVIKLEHNQSKVMDRFKLVQLEITVETNGHDHVRQIQKELKRQGFEIIKIY